VTLRRRNPYSNPKVDCLMLLSTERPSATASFPVRASSTHGDAQRIIIDSVQSVRREKKKRELSKYGKSMFIKFRHITCCMHSISSNKSSSSNNNNNNNNNNNKNKNLTSSCPRRLKASSKTSRRTYAPLTLAEALLKPR